MMAVAGRVQPGARPARRPRAREPGGASGGPLLRRLFPNVYEGWLVVVAAASITTFIGGAFFYGFGTIFNPIIDEFGWSVAATSLAFSVRSEAGGIAAPVIGVAIDRLGPQQVLIGGLALVCAGVLLTSYMESIWHFYLAMVLIALGISSASGPVGTVAAASWFEARRGRALALLSLGGAAAGVMTVPVALLVDELGWRSALRVLAVVVIVAGSLASINVRRRPPGHRQPMDGLRSAPDDAATRGDPWGIPARRAIRTRPFVLLALGLIANGFGWTALIVHQVPFMESLGVSKAEAGSTVLAFALASVVGRLAGGWLADRYEKRVVLSGAIALMALGIALMPLVHTLEQSYLVMLIVAPGFGGTAPLRPALLADYFGTTSFGTIAGLSRLWVTIGSFGGPLTVGLIVDSGGGYAPGWLIAAAVVAAGIPLVLAARPPSDLIAYYRRPAGTRPGRAS
ncbi:MAG: MFS transporter [Chloroflexi bacterium]|nr:MFS transporter [Chloroflexota bacterium]